MARRSKPLPGYKRLPGHKYRTPRGKVITEYEYRSRKARKAGFRNYTQQRRFHQSQDYQKFRFDILSAHPEADLSAGGDLDREIAAVMAHRRDVKGGGEPGSGGMIGEPGDRFSRLLEAMGLPDYWKWRFWYSEVAVG